MDAGDAIEIEVFYDHPVERVWRALTEPALIAKWLMENDFAPVVGHRFTLREIPIQGQWRGYVECRVLAVEPPHRLAYTWDGGSGPPTIVEYILSPAPGGALLRVEHSGFAAGGEWGLTIRDILAGGWTTRLLGDLFSSVLAGLAAEASESPRATEESEP